mgnify:CR=1 FL=1
MLEQGALDGVDAIFGFHIGTLLGADIPSGTVIAPSGCCMAAFDKFTIPSDKVLVVEMHEKSGGRHQTFTVESEDIVRARAINELKVK